MIGPSLYGAMAVALLPTPVSVFETLSKTFKSYIDATSNEASWEATKRRIIEVEEQWHAHGMSGRDSVVILSQLRAHIGWETMVPDHFNKFYRFVFHICKEPKKKHVQADVALEAWRLILPGRFRLLDRFCDFVQGRRTDIIVITEDQWRQVLDFSRSVHEDLSNFHQNGAWVCLLDDFVEHMSQQRQAAPRSQFMDCDDCLNDAAEPSPRAATRMSPHCGSKRRSPDIDVVAEQLSAMPLCSQSSGQLHSLPQSAKKQRAESGPSAELHNHLVAGPLSMGPAHAFDMPQDLMHNLPSVQTAPGSRRVVRTRRSGVSDLVNCIVSDALGFNTL